MLLAFVTGAVATWCYSRIDEPAAPAETIHTPSLVEIARVLRRSRLFLGFVAATLIWNLGFQISLPFFNVYLAGPLGASTTTIGLLNAVMPLTALFSQRWMGRLIDRRGNVWVLIGVRPGDPDFPTALDLRDGAVAGDLHQHPGGHLLDGLQPGRLQSAPRTGSGGGARRLGCAAISSWWRARWCVGPLLGGYLADAYGFNATFGVSAIGRLLGALAFVWWVARPVARQKLSQKSVAAP